MTSSDAGSTPAVSVVVPMYNRATTVGAAIESVLRQTFSDFEVIVVDDCSTDQSTSVVRRISDERVRLILSTTNTGAAGARNLGARHAKGAWIAFQDSDDEWLPLKLERQMHVLSKRGGRAIAAYCGMIRLGDLEQRSDAARPRIDYVPHVSVKRVDGDILDSLLGRSLVSTQTLVVRKDVFETVGGFDESVTPIEDWDLSISIARVGQIACVDEPLVVQRFSPDSITRHVARRVASQVRVVEKNLDVFSARPDLLAKMYFIIAGGYREQGDLESASHYLARCRRIQRDDLKVWAVSSYVALRRWWRRLKPARLAGAPPS